MVLGLLSMDVIWFMILVGVLMVLFLVCCLMCVSVVLLRVVFYSVLRVEVVVFLIVVEEESFVLIGMLDVIVMLILLGRGLGEFDDCCSV